MEQEPEDKADIALMLRAGKGDMAAFSEIVARHQQMIFGTAAKMLGSADDAEDIAQTVFIRAWKAAPNYVPTAKVTTWLLTITRNLVFNESRRRRRATFESFEQSIAPGEDTPRQFVDTAQRDANELIHEQEVTAAVDAAIAMLPENARLAVILRRDQDMPYEDIARVLNLSLANVKTIIFRARIELKERLQSLLDEK